MAATNKYAEQIIDKLNKQTTITNHNNSSNCKTNQTRNIHQTRDTEVLDL